MENKDVKMPPKTRGPMRGPGRGMMPGEKAKDFKWSIGKLLAYLGNYKIGIIVVMIFAACATVFNVVGPKVLGKATTALSEGLMNKSTAPAAWILTISEKSFYLCWDYTASAPFSALYRAGL